MWLQIAVGNVIAAAVMGVALWRAHLELRGEFAHALGGGVTGTFLAPAPRAAAADRG